MRKGLALAALGVGALALVGFRGGCGRGGCARDAASMDKFVTARLDDLLEDIDANEGQRKQIQSIKERLLKDGLALREDSKASRAEALAQLKSANPDSAKLHAVIDARSKAMTDFAHKAADAALEVHKVLTPEQREKLFKKLERHMNRWE